MDIYLLKVTRNNITDLYNNAKEADTGSFRSMLENAYAKSLDNTLNGDGDIEGFMFNGVEAGDYAALVLLNSTGPQSQNLSILSATAFEVLEYDSTITASSSIGSGDSLNVNVELIDAPNATTYTYAAVLIRDDVYRAEMVLSSNGNKMETNFTLNGEYILEAFDLVGLDHSNINANDVQNKVTSLIGPDNGTVIIKTVDSNQTSLSLTTLDLPADKYYLIVGVYKSGDYLVAFEQNDIIINTPLVVEPLAIRTLPKHVETGEQFTVRMEFSDYGTAGLLTETIPSGFTFEDSTHYFKQDGQVITFLLLENDVIEYTVTASETEGDYQFDGTIKDFNKVEATVGGNEWVGVGPFDPHIYDFSHDGSIEKEEVIEAIKDYLIYDRITKDNVIKVIKAYFGI